MSTRLLPHHFDDITGVEIPDERLQRVTIIKGGVRYDVTLSPETLLVFTQRNLDIFNSADRTALEEEVEQPAPASVAAKPARKRKSQAKGVPLSKRIGLEGVKLEPGQSMLLKEGVSQSHAYNLRRKLSNPDFSIELKNPRPKPESASSLLVDLYLVRS